MSITCQVTVGSENKICVSDDRLVLMVLRVVTCPYVAIINEVLFYVDDSVSMRYL